MENEYKADYAFCVKNGAIVGAIYGALSILLYTISEGLLANGILGIVILLSYAIVFGVLGVKYRNHSGGFLSFGQAYSAIFIMVLMAILVSTVFSILLHQGIDPDLGSRLMDITLETSEQMMRRFGAPEDQIQESIAEMGKTNSYSLMNQLKGILYAGIIGNALVSLILAAIAKNNREEDF